MGRVMVEYKVGVLVVHRTLTDVVSDSPVVGKPYQFTVGGMLLFTWTRVVMNIRSCSLCVEILKLDSCVSKLSSGW